MKLRLRILLILLCFTYTFCNADPRNKLWFGNDHFKITQTADLVKVSMKKLPWESFSVDLNEVASEQGIVSFKVKTNEPILLRIDGFTSSNTQVNLFNEHILPGNFKQLHLRLAASGLKMDNLIFYVNPGEAFTGDILIKELKATSSHPTQDAISIYPNPASAFVNITLPSDDFDNISIYDSTGKLVHTEIPVGRQSRINLSKIKTGIYAIKAKGQNKLFTSKIIVQ